MSAVVLASARAPRMRRVGDSLQEWETPQYIVDAVVADSFGGERPALDVAASWKNAKARSFYTKKDNGLVRPWRDWSYCNPPYENQGDWLASADAQALERRVHSANLVLASTSAQYWYVACVPWTIDLYVGRIPFVHPRTLEPQSGFDRASALVLVGPRFRGGGVRYRSAATGELLRRAP